MEFADRVPTKIALRCALIFTGLPDLRLDRSPPHTITAGALKAVIVKFIQRNPQYYPMAAAPVVYAALASAFPCP